MGSVDIGGAQITAPDEVYADITREDLDAARVMYAAGATFRDLAEGFDTSVAQLSWLLIMYDSLGEYTVHYKDSNQSNV